jgi:valyl-tRNA synthetase
MKEIPKNYEASQVEQKWYTQWEHNGFFNPETAVKLRGGMGLHPHLGADGKTQSFCIVIPPPNVTGNLHIGHALDNTIQDILIRYHRMLGDDTLWVPGTDHAGIATQNVVEKELRKTGKRKEDLGREKFLEMVWEWKKQYGGQITKQLRRLGASCDWSRERFTMDEGLSKAVTHEFVTLYNEGLIYRGKRIVNWCPRCQTAISDIETDYEPKAGKLWHIKYSIEGRKIEGGKEGADYIVVATTRPETMLGDTAVAVNPKDARYKHLFGKMLVLPLVGRLIPIVKDEHVEAEFGTGAVKVTPAHDPNDFEIASRHNLPKIELMDQKGFIKTKHFTETLAHKYDGLERFKAREAVVADLEAGGYLEKIEDYQNSVGQCQRCHTVIEPLLSDQWYVAVNKLAQKNGSLAGDAIKVVEEGKIQFVPDRWNKVYLNWMTNLHDWCISRQLWWGHQVPAYYCACGEMIVSETKPTKCPKCGGSQIKQDPDVFDTWFSSCLWPFSTLGWPDNYDFAQDRAKDGTTLIKYYPTNVLVTGYDIITFWVSRMIMMGVHFMGKEPFKVVNVHGLVRDASGRKMSKSIGNTVDPIEMIDKIGADALRFALVNLATGGGQDIKLTQEKMTECRNFCTKLWNVSRFVLMNWDTLADQSQISSADLGKEQLAELADQWIDGEMQATIKKISGMIEEFEYGAASQALYDFTWSAFCDWYIEIAKIRLQGTDLAAKKQVLTVLINKLTVILKLMHPFMPFITEEIWSLLKERQIVSSKSVSLMLESWPVAGKIEKTTFETAQEIIRSIRNIRSTMGVQPGSPVELIIVANDSQKKIVEASAAYIKTLARVSAIKIEKSLKEKPRQAAAAVVGGIELFIPLTGLIDIQKELQRQEEQKQKLEKALGQIMGRLDNPQFAQSAKPEVVAKQREDAKKLVQDLKSIGEIISNLS